MDFFNTISNLDPQLVFYVAVAAWVVLAAIQWRKQLKLRFVVLVVAIALTMLWFERIPSMQSGKIIETALELLKIIISWPFVVLVLLLAFRGQIGEFFRTVIEVIAKSKTTEVAIGDIKVKIESATPLGVVSAPTEESIKTEIAKLIEVEAPTIPIQIPSGVADIFVQHEAVLGGTKISANSGFVINHSGYVVTFGQNLRDAQEVYVRLSSDSLLLPGTVIARSVDKFLAIVKLPKGDYPHLVLDYPELGELVYKYNIRSGVARGRVTSIMEHVRFAGITEIVSDVTTVEPALTQPGQGEGGSPVLNDNGQVIGVVIAHADEPSRSLLISTTRILEEFPIVAQLEQAGKKL